MAFKIVNNIRTARLLQNLLLELSDNQEVIIRNLPRNKEMRCKQYRVQCRALSHMEINKALKISKYKSLKNLAY